MTSLLESAEAKLEKSLQILKEREGLQANTILLHNPSLREAMDAILSVLYTIYRDSNNSQLKSIIDEIDSSLHEILQAHLPSIIKREEPPNTTWKCQVNALSFPFYYKKILCKI